MKPINWFAILLIVLGGLVLAYQGINYTREKNVVDMGSLHVSTETQGRISLPRLLGGLALAGGVVLLVAEARNKS